jgi:hypothetical protein
VLIALLLVAVATAFESSSWLRGVAFSAITAGVVCVGDRFVPRKRLKRLLADARPLPVEAVDVSDSQRDVFLFGRYLFAVLVVVAAGEALLFGAATGIKVAAGAAAGLAVGAVRDSRIIRRWEAENGRLYTERRSGAKRKGRLYVEDPATAPLDAS